MFSFVFDFCIGYDYFYILTPNTIFEFKYICKIVVIGITFRTMFQTYQVLSQRQKWMIYKRFHVPISSKYLLGSKHGSKRKANNYYFAFILEVLQVGMTVLQ